VEVTKKIKRFELENEIADMKLQGWKESKTIDADVTLTRGKNNLKFCT
jgi:hypothetical protein